MPNWELLIFYCIDLYLFLIYKNLTLTISINMKLYQTSLISVSCREVEWRLPLSATFNGVTSLYWSHARRRVGHCRRKLRAHRHEFSVQKYVKTWEINLLNKYYHNTIKLRCIIHFIYLRMKLEVNTQMVTLFGIFISIDTYSGGLAIAP